jgi:NAD(P)H-hydrate epimerase
MIRETAKNMDAVAIGPGLGRHFETRDLVKRFLSGYEGKIVLDADGIQAFAGEPELLRECPGSIVITPHPGELSALTGKSIDDIMEDRMSAVIKAAEATGCIVLLKGAPSVIADPSGDIWINGSGNEGMATAGMGDVLTGTIAGLAAQGLDIKSSAILGAFLHGIAGEIISYERGILGVMAGDVADALSDAIMDILATGR